MNTAMNTTMAIFASMASCKYQAEKMLYEKNKFTDILGEIEAKTRVKREYLAAGALAFLSLYLVFGYGNHLLCNGIGSVYPAYCSIHALKTDRKDDDTRWLTYWAVYAAFSLTDLLLWWFPLYWLAKCEFLVWCFIPIPGNGSDVIYNNVIHPYFLKNQIQIQVDKAMEKVSDEIGEIAGNVTSIATDAIDNHAMEKVSDEIGEVAGNVTSTATDAIVNHAMEKVSDEIGELAGNVTSIATDAIVNRAFSFF